MTCDPYNTLLMDYHIRNIVFSV